MSSPAGARVEVPEPFRPPNAIRLSDALLFVLILAVAAFLRFGRLGADPPLSLSRSNAEVQDGPWYLAEAADAARGRTAQVPPDYHKPAFTAVHRVAFAASGVSLETAHAVAAAFGLGLVVAGAAAAYVAYGTRTALLAALFLATSFPLAGYARVPLVYGPLAAALALSYLFFVAGLRQPAFFGLAWATLALAAVGLKQSAVVLAPALALGHVVAARRKGLAVLLLAGGAVAAAALATEVRPDLLAEVTQKARDYLGADGGGALAITKRFLNASAASGLATKAFPLLLLAWVGVLLALARYPHREGQRVADERLARAADIALAAWLVAAIAGHALFRFHPKEGPTPPIRHFAGALVPAALLAARAIERLRARRGDEGGCEPSLTRAEIALWAFPAAYAAIAAALYAAFAIADWRGTPIRATRAVQLATSAAAIAALAALLAAFAARVLGDRLRAGNVRAIRLAPRAAALAVVAVLVSDAAWLTPPLARPTWTLRSANAAVAQVLGPGATVFGPWAHALTYDAPGAARVYLSSYRVDRAVLEPRSRGATHLAIDGAGGPELERIYRDAGAPLVPLLRLEVRGHPVHLYRFPWAEELGYHLSHLEERMKVREKEARIR